MGEKEKMQTEELARMFPECVRGEPKHEKEADRKT